MGVAPMPAKNGERGCADNVHNFAAAIAEVSQRAAAQELLPPSAALKELGKENQLPFAGDGHVVRKLGIVTPAGCVHGPARLCFLTVDGRRIAAGVTFEDGDTLAYYNAGVDPDARDLSPGVLLVAKYVERAIVTGRRRLDFLRGNEAYKYEWGAIDEPIQRLLVRRASA